MKFGAFLVIHRIYAFAPQECSDSECRIWDQVCNPVCRTLFHLGDFPLACRVGCQNYVQISNKKECNFGIQKRKHQEDFVRCVESNLIRLPKKNKNRK